MTDETKRKLVIIALADHSLSSLTRELLDRHPDVVTVVRTEAHIHGHSATMMVMDDVVDLPDPDMIRLSHAPVLLDISRKVYVHEPRPHIDLPRIFLDDRPKHRRGDRPRRKRKG